MEAKILVESLGTNFCQKMAWACTF